MSDAQREEWIKEFEANLQRPLEQRFRYAFIRTYKPVLDDAPFRAFDTRLTIGPGARPIPPWLGYGTSL